MSASNMKKDSLKTNFIFQTLYQAVVLLIPLFLAPYLTRTLGSEKLGIYGYTTSIAYYFVLFAMLGIAKYGQRYIAQNLSTVLELRKSYWSLFSVHAFFSILALVFYFIITSLFCDTNYIVFLIQGFYVASALFDTTWFFYGIENFRSVVYRNTAVKAVECILILLLVKSPTDLWLYTLICTCSIFLGMLATFIHAYHIAPYVKVERQDIVQHIKPLFLLSLAVLAVSLYTVFDKTLLGFFSIKDDVAYYEYSDKIVSIPRTITAIIGTVMFPRACKLATQGLSETRSLFFKYSVFITAAIGAATFWGLLAISEEFTILYFGTGFLPCAKLMVAMAPLVSVIGIGDVIRTQYLIPNKKDKEYLFGICASAVINIIISISLLISLPSEIKIYGALVGSLSAELFGTCYQIYICRSEVRVVRDIIKPIIITNAIGLVMFILLNGLSCVVSLGLFHLIISVLVGGISFALIFLLYGWLLDNDLKQLILEIINKRK